MHVMITGAAGFIGRNLAARLTAAGHHVTAVDNLSIPAYGPLPEHLAVRDVRDLTTGDLDDVDTVVHLAARKSVPDSFDDPGQLLHNVAVDQHLLHQFVAAAGPRRLLLASSCEVYGIRGRQPSIETDPVSPRSPYAVGKAATEHLADVLRTLRPGKQIACLRFYNTYGPDEGPDAVVPAFLQAVADGRPLPIEGDGSQARDLTHIDDMTAMLSTVLTAPHTLPRLLNLGSGTATTIRAVAQHVIHAAGLGWTIRVAARPNEIPVFVADMSLYRSLYGPPPNRPVAEGIRAALNTRSQCRAATA